MKAAPKMKAALKNGIPIVIGCTFINTIGQILFKRAAESMTSLGAALSTPYLYLGMAFYGTSALLLVMALRRSELSMIYPFISLGFVWVNVASIFLFHETVSALNWSGIALIILGTTLIGSGSART